MLAEHFSVITQESGAVNFLQYRDIMIASFEDYW